LIYYEFLKLKTIFGIYKRFSKKKKNTQADTWQHQGVPRVLLMSARGPPNADVIMTFDDVSIDLVNVDQVNESTGPRPGGVHMSAAPCH
jgi:hypothetical protein